MITDNWIPDMSNHEGDIACALERGEIMAEGKYAAWLKVSTATEIAGCGESVTNLIDISSSVA
jgi:hypothetical protein